MLTAKNDSLPSTHGSFPIRSRVKDISSSPVSRSVCLSNYLSVCPTRFSSGVGVSVPPSRTLGGVITAGHANGAY